MNTVRDANAKIAVACQCQTWMVIQVFLNALQAVGMPQVILRHGFLPVEYAGKQRLCRNPKRLLELLPGNREQAHIVPRDLVFLTSASNEDPE